MKKPLFFALTLILSGSAMADEVKSLSELALLPPYCSGTQQVRSVSKDPTPIEDYMAQYGQPYYHLHHYCWALNSENNAWRIHDKLLRQSKLGYALQDIKYVLDRSGPDFVLLPDILNSQARIQFALHRDAEAVNTLSKIISIKPDYSPAYERLSDYYVDIGKKSQAIAILERGIGNTENAARLIKRLKKLGKTYQGVPGDLRITKEKKSEQSQESSAATTASPSPITVNDSSPKSNPAEEGAAPTQPEPAKANPYCRFCP